MRLRTTVAIATVAATGVAGTGCAVSASDPAPAALGPGIVTVEVGIDHSRFRPDSLRVVEGTVLELVVRNDDPIDHELVVGAPEVHQRHRDGSERRHPPVPGEVSVAPGETAMTSYRVAEVGSVTYACHLPGHEAYGMRGTIDVVAAG